jgi:DNA polymerase IV
MDAFYASIEQRDDPALKGKPVVVGGSPEGRGGVVATASYEARRFGIRSAMPSKKARQLCPDAIFIRPRFDVYKQVSDRIREIFHRYTDMVEPLSLDEAYLDVTVDKMAIGSAIEIAKQIRQSISEELNLTASAGVSVNKFVAKIASDLNKPDGFTFIGPSQIENFISKLPVEKFYGVGKVTAEKMKSMGLHTGEDLKKLSEQDLVRHFGKSGRFFYLIVRGVDDRPVQPNRETKSIGAEDTFPKDLTSLEDMVAELEKIAMVVQERVKKHDVKGRTCTLKIKYHNFRQVTRSQSLENPFDDFQTIIGIARDLVEKTDAEGKRIRLLGITLSNFGDVATNPGSDCNDQLKLF